MAWGAGGQLKTGSVPIPPGPGCHGSWVGDRLDRRLTWIPWVAYAHNALGVARAAGTGLLAGGRWPFVVGRGSCRLLAKRGLLYEEGRRAVRVLPEPRPFSAEHEVRFPEREV